MATIFDLLLARYQHVARITRVGDIPAADLAFIQSQANDPNTALTTATSNIAFLTAGTTQVALMTYQFFTGLTPKAEGLDYLVSPEGPNPTNLNSAYYRNFNVENRYINFSVALGKLGEGRPVFQAGYGSL